MSDWRPEETPSFTPSEMACKCGKCAGEAKMQHAFMLKLQAMRDAYGPLQITSAYRCEGHPEERRKERKGAHGQGRAADIKVVDGGQRYLLANIAIENGMVGVGVAKSFIHVDDGHNYAARPAMWSY